MTDEEIRDAIGAIGQQLETLYKALDARTAGDPEPTTVPPKPTRLWPINKAGIDLIKYFEASGDFKEGGDKRFLKSYKDAVGVWTIGYGHTGKEHNDGSVKEGMTITPEEADDLLLYDIAGFAKAVRSLVKVNLNQDQFAALVSFAFNLGTGNLGSSTLLRLVNAGDLEGAAAQFGRWVYAGKTKLNGLVKRRAAERILFNGKDWRAAV